MNINPEYVDGLELRIKELNDKLAAANRREAGLRKLVEDALHAAKTDPWVRQGLSDERWSEAVKALEAALQPDAWEAP